MAQIQDAIRKAIECSRAEKLKDSIFMQDILDDMLPGEDEGKLLIIRGYSDELGALLYRLYFGKQKTKARTETEAYLKGTAGFSTQETETFLMYFDAAFGKKTGRKPKPVSDPVSRPAPSPEPGPAPRPMPAPEPASQTAQESQPDPSAPAKTSGVSKTPAVLSVILWGLFIAALITAIVQCRYAAQYSSMVKNYQANPGSSYTTARELQANNYKNGGEWAGYLYWENAVSRFLQTNRPGTDIFSGNKDSLRVEEGEKADLFAMAYLTEARSLFDPEKLSDVECATAYAKAYELLSSSVTAGNLPEREKLASECLYHLVLYYRSIGDTETVRDMLEEISDKGFRMLAEDDTEGEQLLPTEIMPADPADPVFEVPMELGDAYIDSSGYIGKHVPENAFDGNDETDWQEAAEGNGIGEWLALDFSEVRTINAVSVMSGSKRDNKHTQNATPTALRMTLDDGRETDLIIPYSETAETCYFRLPFPVETACVLFTISNVHEGTTFNDAVITDITLY